MSVYMMHEYFTIEDFVELSRGSMDDKICRNADLRKNKSTYEENKSGVCICTTHNRGVSVYSNYCRKHLTPQKYPRITVSFKNRRNDGVHIQMIFMNHSLMPLSHISRDSRRQKQLKQHISTKGSWYIFLWKQVKCCLRWHTEPLSVSLLRRLQNCGFS